MKLCSYSKNFQVGDLSFCFQKNFLEMIYSMFITLCTMKMTFKFAFWDRFKEFESIENIRALSNLANLLAHLLGGGCLSLSILKVHHR